MKQAALMLCLVCLLIPVLADAKEPDLSSPASILREETMPMDELHAMMAHLLSQAGLLDMQADEITTKTNILTYVCYYIAFTAIIDFIDCLVYYDISYDCRSAIINGLLFYFFC